jgi:methylmalonyl-CoA mutase cobalamin-binding domain/chain
MASLDVLLSEFDEEGFLAQIKQRLSAGEAPLNLINECQKGMEKVGQLFETKEYFVSDLIMSAGMFSAAMDEIGPYLQADGAAAGQPVVIGTAKGDVHDIGKNIVTTMLRCNGYDVTDIGVDASADKFIEAVKNSGAKLIGISALLTTTFPSIKEIIDALQVAGLRDQVKIIIGGGPVDERVCELVGADGVGQDAMDAVTLANKLLEVK